MEVFSDLMLDLTLFNCVISHVNLLANMKDTLNGKPVSVSQE